MPTTRCRHPAPDLWHVARSSCPRADLAGSAGRGRRATGLWAYEALRVEARRPRLGFETDHRTIPHEVDWLRTAVHLQKGCYRGQETVARVHNLGRPPRRLVLLHLDGSRGRPAGARRRRYGSADAHGRLRHHRRAPPRAGAGRARPGQAQRAGRRDALTVDGTAAAQEVVVAP